MAVSWFLLLWLVVMVMVDMVVTTSQYLTYPGDIMLGGLGQSLHCNILLYCVIILQSRYTSRGRGE